MPLPALLSSLRLPVIAAPMFLVSGPDLVVETCRAGLVGSFPALNPRGPGALADWLAEIGERLQGQPGAAPYAVNLIVHPSNPRLEADLAAVVAARVPLVITSLGAARDVVAAVQGYGGLVFHDVTTRRHAEKALAAGVDGLIAVAAGAGGHGGQISPFALVAEIRQVFAGPLVLGGAISQGGQILAAQAMGADLAYLGTRFLVSRESLASPAQKQMTLAARAADILYTPAISGVPANFLRASIRAAGLDPAALPAHGKLDMAAEMTSEAKAWKTIWSAGQGVGSLGDCPPVAELVARLAAEYRAARAALAGDGFGADHPASRPLPAQV